MMQSKGYQYASRELMLYFAQYVSEVPVALDPVTNLSRLPTTFHYGVFVFLFLLVSIRRYRP